LRRAYFVAVAKMAVRFQRRGQLLQREVHFATALKIFRRDEVSGGGRFVERTPTVCASDDAEN